VETNPAVLIAPESPVVPSTMGFDDMIGMYTIFKADGTFQDYDRRGEEFGKGTWSVSGDVVQFHYERSVKFDMTNYDPTCTLEKGKMVDRNTPGLVVYSEKVAMP
jgi:hypothetical protein